MSAWGSRPLIVLAGSVLALVCTGCGHEPRALAPAPDAPTTTAAPTLAAQPSQPSQPTPPQLTGLPVPQDLDHAFSGLLQRRAAALTGHDRAAFDAGLDPRSPGFVTAQDGYFDNLRQLPIDSLTYRIEPASLVRSGTGYWVVVDVSLQLDVVDAAPVTTPDRYRFSPSGPHGSYRLSSTTDAAWEAANHLRGQPWDIEPIEVRERPGVLGVFDAGTVAGAHDVMGSVQQGARAVQPLVPYDWDGTVTVYVLSDPTFVDGLDAVPGGDPQLLDGLAFTLSSTGSSPSESSATTRVVLNPSVLATPKSERDRLVRHELTHVAVGTHDDRAPVWLREGLAEWVSVQPMDPSDRDLPPGALAAARSPDVRMPRDADFDGADASTDYALAWWSCEYLAQEFGPSAPWALLDALAAPGAHSLSTTRQLIRMSPDQLARHGARLMVRTYDPETPSASPTPSAN